MHPTPSPAHIDRFSRFQTVAWLDAFGLPAGWEHSEDVEPRLVVIVSVGLVLAEDELSLTLAPHVGYLGEKRAQVGGVVTIPKAAIVERAWLVTSTSCSASASAQSPQPSAAPSATSDPEGSSTPALRPSATRVRASEASS